ncbi:hypothetical protein ACFFJQ_10920 [Bacillus capparidis]|uniref:Uncharacterized protein n=3 Tax=Bacillus TaxID=1386 RepID=A0A0M4FIL7_9BACI|nr:hypothetical protein [Bacillus capparidis]ALC81129.1 hypothetical protein AM592_05605 [Bacillus gobiensis]MBP1080095.1 hypothetical protein [Bacillus capparidis]MED1095482.1 hypothetical protein [Bacillus capparidis]
MSLANARLAEVVKKQYLYKLKSYSNVFSSLVMVQMIAILMSFGSTSSSGSSTSTIDLTVNKYSSDVIIAFTLLWGFISAIIITTKAYRYDDFTFVSNRISSHLSNILFLLTASIIGGACGILSGFLQKVLMYFFDYSIIREYSHLASPSELLLGIIMTTLYVFFFSAFGYVIGYLVQIHKLFIATVPVFLLGSMFISAEQGNEGWIVRFFEYYFLEPSVFIFFLKIIGTVAILYTITILMSDKLDVRT